MALAAVLLLPVAIVAGWIEKIAGPAIRGGPPVSPALERAVRYVRGLPARGDVVALAAQGTPEGHWRFVNKSGEMLTVDTPDEMKRVVAVLQPDARPGARLALYMTQDTVLLDRVALRALPAGVDLSVVVGEHSYRLLRRSEPAGERFFAEVRPNLVVEMGDKALFEEALWQLGRRLDAARIRVLALQPGGPATLPASPRVDRARRRPLVDTIDPTSLAPAMHAVAGQTLVIVGRIERDLLYVRPSSGPEHVLSAEDLFKAAAAADVNLLVLLAASTPRQPAGRNRLWQIVEAPEAALHDARVADLLNALGAPNRRLAVAVLPHGRRTVLDLAPAGDLAGPAPGRPVGEFFSNVVSDLTGRATAISLQANLRSATYQHELDHRLLPGIPSQAQIAYGLLAVLGLLGVPVSRAWWQRLWPPEQVDDYAGRAGYWAARAARGLAFALVFVPLTAPVSASCNLGRQVGEAATGPARFWRRLAEGRSTAPPRGPAPDARAAAAWAAVAETTAAKVAVGKESAHHAAPRRAPVASDDGEDRPRFLSRKV